MILEIYITLLCLTLAIIFLGYLVEEGDVLKITGFLFLFSLGIILLNGTLQVENGGTIISNDNGMFVSKTYDNYQNFTFGFYLSLLSVFGFILTYIDRKNSKITNDEED